VGVDAHVLLPLSRVLPARVWTAWVRKQFPSMRRPAPAQGPVADGIHR
jgi:hypothetical protein